MRRCTIDTSLFISEEVEEPVRGTIITSDE